MLVIGSQALLYNGSLREGRVPKDLDVIGSYSEMQAFIKSREIIYTYPLDDSHQVIKLKDCIVEWEIAWENSTGNSLLASQGAMEGLHYANNDVCYALKMSHRFKKDSPHFLKTMQDIKYLRKLGCSIPVNLGEWFIQREKETYDYAHPKLGVDKETFFKEGEGVPYIYDHDSMHRAVALRDYPAYMDFKPEQEEVFCSREMFEECHHNVKLNSVVEESMVLSLERSLVPYDFTPDPDKIFKYALMKVCTSITSGYWRTFAWEHYDEAIEVYRKLGSKFMESSLKNGLSTGLVKPFK